MTPDRWTRARLGDLCSQLGRGVAPKYVEQSGSVFAINQKCVRDGRVTSAFARPHNSSYTVKSEAILKRGDICVNSTGTGTIGRVGLWDSSHTGTFFVDTHVTLVRPDPSQAAPRFLCEVLLSSAIQREMRGSCFTGTTNQVELSKSRFAALELILPPVEEQRKIATILASVDDAIETTQAVIDQLQVVKKAMMAELLTPGLPGRQTPFKQTEIGEVPEDWSISTVGELASFCGGNGFTPRDWSSSGLPIIRIQNLNGSKGFNYYDGVPETDWLVQPGELLFAWAGSRGASFGPCIWPGPLGVLNQHIYHLTPDLRRVTKLFLFYVLRIITEEIEKRAHGFKTTLVHLRKSELTGWRLALPPLAEQERITAILQSIEERVAAEEGSLKSLHAAKEALSSALLTGEVRVTPDEAAP